MKICSRKDCSFVGQIQSSEAFYKDKTHKDSLTTRCKLCINLDRQTHKEQIKAYRKQHIRVRSEKRKEYERKYREIHKEETKERQKKYREIHKQELKENQKQWYEKNKEKVLAQRKEYRLDHQEQIIEYRRTHKKEANVRDKLRKQEDPCFKVKYRLRIRLNSAIKRNYKSGSAVADLCMSISDFKIYLEERFYPNPDTGEMMTWENYGRPNGQLGWDIDHIVPLSSFDLSKREELLKACHFSNLRPMWARQNYREGARGMSRKQTQTT